MARCHPTNDLDFLGNEIVTATLLAVGAICWALLLVLVQLPIFVLARRLNLRGSGWALVPFGDIITLGRCTELTWGGAALLSVFFAWPLVLRLHWRSVCRAYGISQIWLWLGPIGCWVIALRVPRTQGIRDAYRA